MMPTVLSLNEIVGRFSSIARACQLNVDNSTILRLASSLLSKRFLIVTGLSGSGKTKLAQAFARWLTPPPQNPDACYALVAVGADWTGNENILGYPDGIGETRYITKPALDLILRAYNNPAIPHFLILDEMNLSHVERYFADILSAIESGEKIYLHRDTERKAGDAIIPRDIELPSNLFIIGTVNVDETTYMFSPKVLDRANVIEFRMAPNELSAFLDNPSKPDLVELDGKGHEAGFGTQFVEAANSAVVVPDDVKDKNKTESLLLFNALQKHGAEFGFRTASETARFLHFYKLLGNCPDDGSWFSTAFDCVILQKMLPKLHGSRAKLAPLLKTLWFLCTKPEAERTPNPPESATVVSGEPTATVPPNAPYPMSAEKIARMWRLLKENGFASFAEA